MASIISQGDVARSSTNNAQLHIETANGQTTTFVCQFNPEQLDISTGGRYSQKKRTGKNSPIVQYVGGGSTTLNLKLFFNTSSYYEVQDSLNGKPVRKSGSDVTKYVSVLMNLVRIEGKVHRPPQVTFEWGSLKLTGNVNNVSVRYTMFETGGMPVRAEVSLAILSTSGLEFDEEKFSPKESPDRTKCIVMTSYGSLWSIAQQEYGDAGRWREIAKANGIMDPLHVPVGTTLKVPALHK